MTLPLVGPNTLFFILIKGRRDYKLKGQRVVEASEDEVELNKVHFTVISIVTLSFLYINLDGHTSLCL